MNALLFIQKNRKAVEKMRLGSSGFFSQRRKQEEKGKQSEAQIFRDALCSMVFPHMHLKHLEHCQAECSVAVSQYPYNIGT